MRSLEWANLQTQQAEWWKPRTGEGETEVSVQWGQFHFGGNKVVVAVNQ